MACENDTPTPISRRPIRLTVAELEAAAREGAIQAIYAIELRGSIRDREQHRSLLEALKDANREAIRDHVTVIAEAGEAKAA